MRGAPRVPFIIVCTIVAESGMLYKKSASSIYSNLESAGRSNGKRSVLSRFQNSLHITAIASIWRNPPSCMLKALWVVLRINLIPFSTSIHGVNIWAQQHVEHYRFVILYSGCSCSTQCCHCLNATKRSGSDLVLNVNWWKQRKQSNNAELDSSLWFWQLNGDYQPLFYIPYISSFWTLYRQQFKTVYDLAISHAIVYVLLFVPVMSRLTSNLITGQAWICHISKQENEKSYSCRKNR